MTNPLTDEKLKAARCWATISPSPSFDDKPGHVTVADLVAEIDRLREAMGKVPHLCESDCGAAFCVADDPDHREEYCAAFGAACALAALRESKEGADG